MKSKCSICCKSSENSTNFNNEKSLNKSYSKDTMVKFSLMPKEDSLFFSWKNCKFLRIAELGTIFYGFIAIFLHSISLILILNQLKKLVINIIIDLNLNILNDYNNYGLINLDYKFILLNRTGLDEFKARQFIFKELSLPFTFIILSLISTIIFAVNAFFKNGNIANDDIHLGNDLALFEETSHNLIKKKNSIFNSILITKKKDRAIKLIRINNLNNHKIYSKSFQNFDQNESDDNITSISKCSSIDSLTTPLSSGSISSSSRFSSSPIRISKDSTKNQAKNEFSIDNSFHHNYKTENKRILDDSFFLTNENIKKANFWSYLPSTCSCFHLMMCFFLLIARLCLNKFKCSYNQVRFNDISIQLNKSNISISKMLLTNKNISNTNLKENLDFIYFLHDNQNKTSSKIFSFFEEINLSLNNILDPISKYISFDLKNDFQEKNSYSPDILIEIGSILIININYLNYFFAFIIFIFKSTRVFSKINKFYAILVFFNLILFTCLNFTAFPAFEMVFNSNSIMQKKTDFLHNSNFASTKKSSISNMIKQQITFHQAFPLIRPEIETFYSNDSIFGQNTNFIINMNLANIIPRFFGNEYFMLITFIIGWLLNLVYLSSLNMFGISFFRDAQLRTELKFQSYIKSLLAKKNEISTLSSDILLLNPPAFSTSDNEDNFAVRKTIKSSVLNGENQRNVNKKTKINKNQFLKKSKQKRRVRSPLGLSVSLKKANNGQNIQLINQYKSIITGIFIFLITETMRFPFIYTCYIEYFVLNLDTFLIALISQLTYLLFNAFFWIILSFKSEWPVKLSEKFKILLWHKLSNEKFYKIRFNKNQNTFFELGSEMDQLNRTSSTRIHSENSKKTFNEDSFEAILQVKKNNQEDFKIEKEQPKEGPKNSKVKDTFILINDLEDDDKHNYIDQNSNIKKTEYIPLNMCYLVKLNGNKSYDLSQSTDKNNCNQNQDITDRKKDNNLKIIGDKLNTNNFFLTAENQVNKNRHPIYTISSKSINETTDNKNNMSIIRSNLKILNGGLNKKPNPFLNSDIKSNGAKNQHYLQTIICSDNQKEFNYNCKNKNMFYLKDSGNDELNQKIFLPANEISDNKENSNNYLSHSYNCKNFKEQNRISDTE